MSLDRLFDLAIIAGVWVALIFIAWETIAGLVYWRRRRRIVACAAKGHNWQAVHVDHEDGMVDFQCSRCPACRSERL
jgi:hypothetical protein